MVIDYSRLAEPDNWFNGFDEGGNLVKYVADPQNGNRLVTQADRDALRAQQDQQIATSHQGLINAGGVWAGDNPSVRPPNVPGSWLPGADEYGRYFWGPPEWQRQHHNDSFFGSNGFFAPDAYDPRALLNEMPGLPILLAPLAGLGAGAAAGGDAALAGGGEVGSGYAASAPAAGAGYGAAGSSGAGSLYGSAGNDTLGTSQGNSMWDFVDQNSYDTGAFDQGGSQGVFDSYGNPIGDPNATGSFDQFGGNNPNGSGNIYNYQSPVNYSQIAQQYGPQAAKLLQSLVARGAGRSQGGGILDTIANDPLQAGFNSLPFLLAMQQANAQGNQVNPILARMSGLADTAASNTNGLVASAVDPYDKQTMYGRDALMTDQSLRGVRGSSFGDQGITNYDTTRGMGRADIVGSTQAKSLGLQGSLLGQQLAGTTNAATSRNLLIGAGLSASGKLFQPQTDPFGLANLLALGNT